MKCGFCGTPINSGMTSCPRCGHAVYSSHPYQKSFGPSAGNGPYQNASQHSASQAGQWNRQQPRQAANRYQTSAQNQPRLSGTQKARLLDLKFPAITLFGTTEKKAKIRLGIYITVSVALIAACVSSLDKLNKLTALNTDGEMLLTCLRLFYIIAAASELVRIVVYVMTLLKKIQCKTCLYILIGCSLFTLSDCIMLAINGTGFHSESIPQLIVCLSLYSLFPMFWLYRTKRNMRQELKRSENSSFYRQQ